MKTKLKEKVLDFMLFCDTSNLNTNNFILDFYRFLNWEIDMYKVRNWPSFESISRARRYRLAHREDLKRSEVTQDSEVQYKQEFTRVPVWII